MSLKNYSINDLNVFLILKWSREMKEENGEVEGKLQGKGKEKAQRNRIQILDKDTISVRHPW
jgi:hypothetical protein